MRRARPEDLSNEVLRRLERHYGLPLGDARVHADGHAQRVAEGFDAKAVTRGSDIFFGPGQFRPQTRQGLELLAHEMAHVKDFKQGNAHKGSRYSAQYDARLGSQKLETAAERSAKAFMTSGQSAPSAAAIQDASIQLAPDSGGSAAALQAIGSAALKLAEAQLKQLGGDSFVPQLAVKTRIDLTRPAQTEARRLAGMIVSAARARVKPAAPPGGAVQRHTGNDVFFRDVTKSSAKKWEEDRTKWRPVDLDASEQRSLMTQLQLNEDGASVNMGDKQVREAMKDYLLSHGLVSAGPNALGVACIPQATKQERGGFSLPVLGMVATENTLDSWGHTAFYVRHNNKIQGLYGFNPAMESTLGSIWMMVTRSVEKGLQADKGELCVDDHLLWASDTTMMEYPVSEDIAALAESRWRKRFDDAEQGKGSEATPPVPKFYSAKSSLYTQNTGEASVSNCVGDAITMIEMLLNEGSERDFVPVGRVGDTMDEGKQTSIKDIIWDAQKKALVHEKTAGSQYNLIKFIRELEEGKATATKPPNATADPVVGTIWKYQLVREKGQLFIRPMARDQDPPQK